MQRQREAELTAALPCVCGHTLEQHQPVRMSVTLSPNRKPLYDVPAGMGSIANTSLSAPYDFDSCSGCGCMTYEEMRPEPAQLRGYGTLVAAVMTGRSPA